MRRPLLHAMSHRPSLFVRDNGWSRGGSAEYGDATFVISRFFLSAVVDDGNVGFFPVCTV